MFQNKASTTCKQFQFGHGIILISISSSNAVSIYIDTDNLELQLSDYMKLFYPENIMLCLAHTKHSASVGSILIILSLYLHILLQLLAWLFRSPFPGSVHFFHILSYLSHRRIQILQIPRFHLVSQSKFSLETFIHKHEFT